MIKWIVPQFNNETDEYFKNQASYNVFKQYNLVYDTLEQLITFLQEGSLTSLDKEVLLTNSMNLTLDKDDFIKELSDDIYYADSFHHMNLTFLHYGYLELEAPIFILFNDLYYCFSGNRRIQLAISNNLELKVWLIKKII